MTSDERKGIFRCRQFGDTFKRTRVMPIEFKEGGQIVTTQETRLFTEDSIYEVTMLSKTETGKKFRDLI